MKTAFNHRLLWALMFQLFLSTAVAASKKIEKINVEPASERESVIDSLPFKEGDLWEQRFLTIGERLLRATDRFEDVAIEWGSDSSELLVRVHAKDYFEGIDWVGDRVAETSRIERLCVLNFEPLNMSQERLSQINRCVVGELQADGFLDAAVGIKAEGKTLVLDVQLGEVYLINKISIEGLSGNREKIEIRRMSSEVGKPFRPLRAKDDTALILKDLLKSGYFLAEVFQPLVQVSPETHGVVLKWNVKLGVQYDVRFLGEYTSPKPLNEMIAREETFPKWFIEELQDDITRRMREEGYLDAEVIVRRKREDDDYEMIKLVTVKGDRYEVTAPDLVGAQNPAAVQKSLKKFSELSSGTTFNRSEYKKTIEDGLTSALYQDGYLDVQVRGVDFTIDKSHSKVHPVIYLSEGDQYFIRDLKIEGLDPFVESQPEWKDFMGALRVGSPFNQPLVDQTKADLQRALVFEGYLDAKVSADFRKGRSSVDVKVGILLGPRYRVAKVLVRGANRTHENILRAEADIHEGDLYLDNSVREGIANILRLGIARSIDIRVLEKDPEAGQVYVLIDLVEAARFRFEIGPGYGTLDGIRGVFKGTYANIGGTGRRLSLFAKANRKLTSGHTPDPADYLDPREVPFIERRMTLEYFEPRLFSLPVDGRLSFSNSKQDFPLFGLFKNTFAAALDYRLNRFFTFTTQYDLEYLDPFNVKKGENIKAFDDERAKTLTSVSELVLFQFLDDNFNPIRGVRTRASAALFHPAFGGDEGFWQTTLKQDFYYPAWRFSKTKILGLALALNAGFSEAMGSTEEIPVTKRYYVGGESSVRGFDDQSINPAGKVGGKSYFYFQTELNAPLAFGVDLLGFFDGGNLYADNAKWRPWGLRYGAGAGLRWNTPVGPLKIGYGFNLHRRRIDGELEPFGAFYFGVGVI